MTIGMTIGITERRWLPSKIGRCCEETYWKTRCIVPTEKELVYQDVSYVHARRYYLGGFDGGSVFCGMFGEDAGGAVSGSTAIFGSTTGGCTADSGEGTVGGAFWIPGSIVEGGTGFGTV